jgi:hypothetical protein
MLQRVQAYTTQVFSFSRFAHHYSGNNIRFLFLALLRCFSSRRSLLLPYIFRQGYLTFSQVGFPIRKSPDHRSIDSSPKLKAVFRFLLRLLIPWNPPNALFNYLLTLIHSAVLYWNSTNLRHIFRGTRLYISKITNFICFIYETNNIFYSEKLLSVETVRTP